MAKIEIGGVYTFNPSKKEKVWYAPEFSFVLYQYDQESGRIYLYHLIDKNRIIEKNAFIIDQYWYKHTQDEIDTYEILYGR